MCDVLPENCGQGVTRELAHCRGATPRFGFPIIQASSCAHHPSNALKLPGKTVCLPSDHASSRSVPSVLDGTQFKKFGLFFEHTSYIPSFGMAVLLGSLHTEYEGTLLFSNNGKWSPIDNGLLA